MRVRSKQIQEVLALTGPERFKFFVKVVADWQNVWGLYRDGWALASSEDGAPVFPLWPTKEYAQLCADNEWTGYLPRSIVLTKFIEVLLPKLKLDSVRPRVFFTPAQKGVTPSVTELLSALDVELRNY